MIHASAPGKVILWGEYAVLSGAPALVMAVDRRATCDIEPGGNTWRFTTRGFRAADTELDHQTLIAEQPPRDPAARIVWYAFNELLRTHDQSIVPAGARVITDSQEFYLHGKKLGIGSSAAVCTAVYAACCQLLGAPAEFSQARVIHNAFQNKRGSGIDVAAAFYGGTLRFRSGTATPFELPPDLQLRFLWSGHPASTTSHIERFNAWRELRQPAPLTALADTCQALFEQTNLATFARYTDQLKALDAAASLGIYSTAHDQLDRLAIEAEVVYKPCGAGGGDIGMAISHDSARLDRFAAAAADLGFDSVPLEKARHGVQVAH